MIMRSVYTEEDKERIRVTNKEVMNDLKKAIIDNKVKEYFDSFGFKPRYLELIDIAFCYPDGEQIILNLYEYIKQNIRDVHVPAMVNKLVVYPNFQPLITRDYDDFLNRTIKTSNLFTSNAYNLTKDILKIPNGEELILPRINDIMDNVNPTLVWEAILLFKDGSHFYQLLKDNFEYWISISRGISVINLVKVMLQMNHKYTIDFIKREFETILVNIGGGQILPILLEFSHHPELVTLMKEKKETIISLCNNHDVNNITESLDETIGLGILKENEVIRLLREKLPKEKHSHGAMGAIIRSRRSEYIKTILEQLMVQEDQNDFTSIGNNTWSNIVFKIGSKVLKIGWIRNNPDCPTHYRIIDPEYFEIAQNKYSDPILYTEIQPVISQEGITEEDVKDCIKDLEDDGYIYIDPGSDILANFGILDSKRAYEIQNKQKVSENFKRKALVLLDRDFVWHKNNPNIKYPVVNDD